MEIVYAKIDHGRLECESVTAPHRIEAINGNRDALKIINVIDEKNRQLFAGGI